MAMKDRQDNVRERIKETRKAIGKNVERQAASLQKGIENSVKLVVQTLDIPTRKEINDLEKKVDLLAAKLEKLEASEKAAKKATAKK